MERSVGAALAVGAPHVRGEVAVRLIGDAQMRKLNAAWRGVDRATDVLSFEIGDGDHAHEPFGDVVISIDAARRQARDYGAPLREELVRLSVHGALHLCGYDHQSQGDARRMHGLTRRLVREVLTSRG